MYFRLWGLRQLMLHVRLRFTPSYFACEKVSLDLYNFLVLGRICRQNDRANPDVACSWWKRFFHKAHEYMAMAQVHTGIGLRWNFVNMYRKTLFFKSPLSIKTFLCELADTDIFRCMYCLTDFDKKNIIHKGMLKNLTSPCVTLE